MVAWTSWHALIGRGHAAGIVLVLRQSLLRLNSLPFRAGLLPKLLAPSS